MWIHSPGLNCQKIVVYLHCGCRRSWHTTYVHRSKRRFLLAKTSITSSRSMSIKRPFFIYILIPAKNYQVAGKQTFIFLLLPTASSFLITSLSGWGGGGCKWPGGGGCREGEGDAHASCASPLGMPLTPIIQFPGFSLC
jgi:hypothetical protein